MADTSHQVSEIHLDQATRERLVKELEIPGGIESVPDTIYIARPQSFAANIKPVRATVKIPQIWSLVAQ